MTARLLADIHTVFEANGDERFKTAELIERLCEIEESPWGDWHGKAISPHGLSKLLRPHRIKTMPVWTEGKTVRGYKVEQFDEAWFRVLGVRRVRNVRSESPSQKAPNATNAPNAVTRDGAAEPDLAEVLCLVCELRPIEGGPCSMRCSECRENSSA
jgi:hypothetical protein